MKHTSNVDRFFKKFWERASGSYYHYNEDWDTLLKILIEDGNVIDININSITFEYIHRYTVMTARHPYASGTLMAIDDEFSKGPRVICNTNTVILLEDFVDSHVDEKSGKNTAYEIKKIRETLKEHYKKNDNQ